MNYILDDYEPFWELVANICTRVVRANIKVIFVAAKSPLTQPRVQIEETLSPCRLTDAQTGNVGDYVKSSTLDHSVVT